MILVCFDINIVDAIKHYAKWMIGVLVRVITMSHAVVNDYG